MNKKYKKKISMNLKFTSNVAPIIEVQNKLGKKYGLVEMTPPTPDLLFDPTGKEIARRQYQFGQRAGLESGRYLKSKNETYIENYIKALERFPNKEFWKDTIERMRIFQSEHLDTIQYTDFLGDVFPPLNDWYPSNKGYTQGKQLSYKGDTDIDLVSDNLLEDINWTLDILGVRKIVKKENV